MKPQDIRRDPQDAVTALDGREPVRVECFGRRAAMLARLAGVGLPVPSGVALSFESVRGLGAGAAMPDLTGIDPGLDAPGRLLALRASPEERAWGGPPALLNIGIGARSLPLLAARLGEGPALDLQRRFIIAFALCAHDLDLADPGPAPDAEAARAHVETLLAAFAAGTGAPFPDDPRDQLEAAARAMARRWHAPSARILRAAGGAPEAAGLGLIVQEMALGIPEACGSIQSVNSRTGVPEVVADIAPLAPAALATLTRACAQVAGAAGDACRLAFALRGERIAILDAQPVQRSARAAVRIAVDLVKAGAITRAQALLRIEPRSLVEHLHPQIDPAASRDVFATGLGASPGAATGRIVFTAEAAQALAAHDEAAILVRIETSAEDIRGMHSARGVLTMRGGMTSHAAVIARGIGLPCVVGAGGLRLDAQARSLATADGRVFHEGAVITLDGSSGEVMAGAPAMIAPELGGALAELLDWADAVRDIGVRANADTPTDARLAREFRVDGLGLCRTEHMFFDETRIGAMRTMILADDEPARRAALERLLPMQRADFTQIFEIMRGLPVTIRLLDPPLHEFLPADPAELAEFARETGLPLDQVAARGRELAEVNPMLGMRGVRVGVLMPAIYDMQARAIFEAAIAVNRDARAPVVPEIMIPLVSAYREVELVRARIEAVHAAVEREQGATLAWRLGVMVETPRAALRAGDIAASSAFLSFGTNDLTQMTYGLSRDDAGRFMRDYVNRGVFHEDPFRTLDLEGVGELMLIAARRGRERNPGLVLGLCGEHGGDPAAVRFCKVAGFDYVSCSPFRVPIARLAAAQACLLAPRAVGGAGGPDAGE